MKFYKLEAKDVTVLYDEIDLAPGKVRVKVGGGNGGHNGLRSIDPQIGTDYSRVRLGVGHPGHKDAVIPTCSAISPRPTTIWLEAAARRRRRQRRHADHRATTTAS